jgi:hypothetical protein
VQLGGKIVSVQLDISDRNQVAALWSKVPQESRNVDILGALIFFFVVCHHSNIPTQSNSYTTSW